MPTKILAIDDSKTMRLAIKITFAAEDTDVTSVSKGTDAVARAKQLGADVVLLDASLADDEPSGLEVCKQLKADDATKSIPVILMVSNQAPPSASDISDAGADESIAKPFDTQDLIEKVAAVQGKEATKAVSSMPVRTPAAARPAAKPPVAAKPPAAKPPVAAKPAPPKPLLSSPRPARAPASTPPTATAAAKQRVGAITEVGMPTPIKPGEAAGPKAAAPARPLVAPAGGAPADIPIAIPIPFTAASSPTKGMLERLEAAAGDSGLDPQVAEALVKLSREVIEKVVWEVVPELAESIINDRASAS